MNYINHNDAYRISKVLTESGNIYGLNSSSTDSHLMKNSEWGAVSYLSQSKYGLDGTEIVINSVYLNNTTKSIYAVTGCASSTADASAVSTTIGALNNRTQSGVYVWKQKNGIGAKLVISSLKIVCKPSYMFFGWADSAEYREVAIIPQHL